MAHIFVANGMRIIIQGEVSPGGEEVLHAFHAITPAPPPDYAMCLAVANAVKGWWDNVYRGICHDGIVGRQVVVTGMNAVPAAQATVALSTAGTRTDDPVSNQVTLALKFAGNFSGRRRRGRGYTWPTDRIGLIDQNHWSGSYIAAAIGAFTDLGSRIAVAGAVWGVFSPTDGVVWPITRVVAVDDIVDSQRRRAPGRGR